MKCWSCHQGDASIRKASFRTLISLAGRSTDMLRRNSPEYARSNTRVRLRTYGLKTGVLLVYFWHIIYPVFAGLFNYGCMATATNTL